MGSQAPQENAGSQVFYDPQKGQYYTVKTNSQNQGGNLLVNMLGGIISPDDRNYFGSSLTSPNDRFTSQYVEPNYPNMNELFPALDIGLAQNLQNSLLAPTNNTPSSGAGRFLSSSNTQGK
jgi:hypothetical protein